VVAKDVYPCKIVDISTSKTGKHGHAKAHITCIDIFTGKKFELNEPTSHNLLSPNVGKDEYDLISLEKDGSVTYLDKEGEYNTNLKMDVESDLFKTILKDLEGLSSNQVILISVTTALGISQVTSHRKE
jgi:translation initiation factor 5A